MNVNLLKSSLLAMTMCFATEAAKADTTVTQELQGHISIMGSDNYQTGCNKDTMFFLNKFNKYCGAGILAYTLDNDFDVSQIKSAELQLYVADKINKNKSGKILFVAMDNPKNLPTTVTTSHDGKVKVYNNGDNAEYKFGIDAAVEVDHSAMTNYSLSSNKYHTIDVTNLIKQFTKKKAGDGIYIGMKPSFVAETWIKGYGSKNPPVLKITYAMDKVHVSDAKFATYSPSENIEVPSDGNVKFYAAKISGKSIVLAPVAGGTVLKAGTGYVIAAESGDLVFSLSGSGQTTDVEGNELKVAGTDGVTATANTKYYVLTKRTDGKVGFGKVKDGVTIPAGKCYIDASTTPTAASLSADFLEMTNVLTGIDAVEAEQPTAYGEADADAYYTLQGVRVSQPVKGINIINGKKVIVK